LALLISIFYFSHFSSGGAVESLELKVDVSSAVAMPGPLHIAATVFLPDPAKLTSPPVAIFGFPGGGYSKGYYDLHPPGHSGYSEVEHHVKRGFIFVAADHLGVGASSIPDLTALTIEMLGPPTTPRSGRSRLNLRQLRSKRDFRRYRSW
jgi:hypothetical protein